MKIKKELTPAVGPRFMRGLPRLELTDKQGLADRYGFGIRTIEGWTSEGVIPSMRIRRVVRFHIPSVDEALLKHGK